MKSLPLLADLKGLAGKKVLLRADLNVPLEDGCIQDEYRIESSLPTIQSLQNSEAIITVCSHLGRPKGKPEKGLSIAPVAERLKELAGDMEVMENLRFSSGETECSQSFVQSLVAGQDFFINDAFGASHRAHASIIGPPKHLPSAAGLLLEKEVTILQQILTKPKRPFLVILGGAKVSDKLSLVKSLIQKADAIAIGGAMAFSFLVASGYSIKDPLVEKTQVGALQEILNSEHGSKVHLPEDLTALNVTTDSVRQIGLNVPEEFSARDIGPGTAAKFCDLINEAGCVFWNGPQGVFEDPRFSAGTTTIAETLAQSRAVSIVGGGDSAAAVRTLGLAKDFNHISTGGGATLEFLEQGDLVGLKALRESDE